jgi:S1-C subfamily serine protease
VLRPPRALGSVAPLLVAAVVGGGVALAGAEVTGLLDDETNAVETAEPTEASAPAAFEESSRKSINQIYRESAPGVVQITTTSIATVEPDPFLSPFGFPEQQEQRALGSGFVIDKSGHIVTNAHVVEGARKIEVSFSNRDKVEARTIGQDPSTDLAVLRVDVDARALTPLQLGNSDGARVGDSVVAIGNPLGLERSVTAGIVSALHRPLTAPNDFTIDDVIQTDAAINSGNSGGPLLAANGRVIGVNTAIATGNTGARGNIGIGFAVPINTVRDVASQLIDRGRVEHPFLGVGAQAIDEEIAELFNLPVEKGLLVVRVYEGSGADKAGLRAGDTEVVVAGESYRLGGDVIVEVDGEAVETPQELSQAVSAKKPGDKIKVEAYRGDDKRTFEVTLGRRPASAQG